MTSEANLGLARPPAPDSAGPWEGIALPPDLLEAVERAAAAAGVDPVSWLARAVSRAADGTSGGPRAASAVPSARDVEIARSLTRLLAAVRAREGESPATETAPPSPPRVAVPEPPALVRLTAEQARAEQEMEIAPAARPPKRRHGALLLVAALLLAALVGIGAFYLIPGDSGAIREISVNVPLPQSTVAPTAVLPPPATPTPATPVTTPPAPAASSPPPTAPSTSAPPTTAESPQAAPPSTASTAPTVSPGSATPAPEPAGGTPALQPPTAAPSAPTPASAPPPAPTAPSTGPTESASAPPSESGTPPETGTGGSGETTPAEALAAFRLGVRYAFGDGVAQDYQKAAEEFRIAAQQGLPDAQYNLGALYDSGLGVPRDPVRAVIWYHSAAEQGHPSAQLNLGLAYANGSGVAQDYGEAARWFRRAADQGVVTAQYNLAALYANGKGVTQSMVDAYAWFSIAAGSGDTEAKNQMQRVAATLNAKQLRDAKALAISLGQEIGHTGEPQLHGPVSPPDTGSPHQPSGGSPAVPPDNASTPLDRAAIAEIQRYLIRLHYDPGRADGQMSDQTADAIRKYETDRSVKVDGEPTRTLLFRLKAEVQKQAKQ